MGRLTGGHFELIERRKIGDYEHREFKAGYTYSFDEGEAGSAAAFLDKLQADLRLRVASMVSGKAIAASTAAEADPTADAPAEPPKAKRGRPKAAAAKPAAVDEDPTVDPVDDMPVDADPTADPAGEPDVVDDPAAEEQIDFDEPEPAKAKAGEVTDAALNEAVQAVNMKLKKPAAIRELIKKFGGPPLASVPQKQRAAFMKELKALK